MGCSPPMTVILSCFYTFLIDILKDQNVALFESMCGVYRSLVEGSSHGKEQYFNRFVIWKRKYNFFFLQRGYILVSSMATKNLQG
jgi:hypothetical protein